MCRLYYPYFKIEKSGCREKYQHKLYLYVLALFCEKIVIPSRHLLEVENDKFDILLESKELFRKNIICSRIPNQKNTLLEYYNSIKDSIVEQIPEIVEIRINRIINDLYVTDSFFEKYEPLEQQSYYSEKIKVFLAEYKKRPGNVKGLQKIILYCNRKEFVTKEEFDKFIKNALKNGWITKNICKRLRKASDLIYFIAGASSDRIKVCYDTFFEHQCIRTEIENTISNFDEIINQRYNPEFLIKFLMDLDVIHDRNELQNLNINDILRLRKHLCFEKFIKEYEKYSVRLDFEKFYERKKHASKYICTIKSAMVSTFFTVFCCGITTILTSDVIFSIVLGLVSSVITYVGTYLWKKNKYEIPLLEGILDKVIALFDPIALYIDKMKCTLLSD